MKKVKLSITANIGILICGIILILSAVTIVITYIATFTFHQATTQLLNKDVAAHIAKFTSPFEGKHIDKKIADSVFYNAMVLNPTVEVYFLDPAGTIMYYQKDNFVVKIPKISIVPIHTFIAGNGEKYIEGEDPKQPDEKKIFSAAEVRKGVHLLGYIYVILGSHEYRSVNSILFGNHISLLSFKIFVSVIIFSFLISFLYIRRLHNKFTMINNVVNRFEEGDIEARFEIREGDELGPITNAFNKVANQLSGYIHKLREVETERKNFIANISHDIKTPLAVAHGYAETLVMNQNEYGKNKEEEKKYLLIICKKINQVGSLVSGLSELLKIEAVGFVPNKEPFVFAELLEESAISFQIALKNKNISITFDNCEEPALIFADIKMMERVVQNLLENAIKHTPENESIFIGLTRLNNILELKLENSANPLSDEMRDWINSKEDHNQLRPYATGLGLVIIKKILYLHNYSFHVERNSGPGNIFIIQMDIDLR